MSEGIIELKRQVLEYMAAAEHCQSLVESFFTGDVPEGACLDHFILAQYGRIRLDSRKATAALLGGEGR